MPGDSPSDPIVRPTARVIVLDDLNRLLLFTTDLIDPDTGTTFWFPPGGGLEDGETHQEAARRELREETGIDAEIGPWLWDRDHTWQFRGQWIRSVERYFLVRVPETHLDRAGCDDSLEMQPVTGFRWWTPEEVALTAERLVPRALPTLLPLILGRRIGRLPHTVD